MASFAEYRAIDAISSGAIRRFLKSPKHYKQGRADELATVAMRIGSAVHCAIMEPDLFERRHPMFEGKTRRGRAWDEFVAMHSEAEADEILSATELERVRRIERAIRNDAQAMRYLRNGLREVTLTWVDEDTALRCKGRPDLLLGPTLIDLKTCNGRDFGQRFESHALNRGYHLQAAFYLDGARASGIEIEQAVLVVAENEEPFDVAVYRLRTDLIERGRHEYKTALRGIVECEASGHWPGIAGDSELELGVPDWAIEWPPKPISADPTVGRNLTSQTPRESDLESE